MRPLRLIRCYSLANPRDVLAARRDAFTLVELALVLLIMGVFAAVSVPTFLDSLLYHRVESAARRLKTDLELARETARLKSASVPVTFTGSSYTLGGGVKSLDNPGAVYVVDLAASPFSVDSLVVSFNSTNAVTFDGYGTPSSGGTVALKCKSHTCTVTLDGVTGEATISSNHPSGGVVAADGAAVVGP